MASTSTHVSLTKPFSTGDATEWFQRYEICSRANSWDDDKKAIKLPTLLEGEALAVWLELNEAKQKDYAVAKKKIIETIMPMRFVSLGDFHKQALLPGEPLRVCPPVKATPQPSHARPRRIGKGTITTTSIPCRFTGRHQQTTPCNGRN